MAWTVELLNATVERELDALPQDVRARFSRIVGLIEEHGLENVHYPHVDRVAGKLWEIRLKGKRRHRKGALCDCTPPTRRRRAGVREEDSEDAEIGN